MRVFKSVTVATGILAGALAVSAGAQAGKVCNRLDLSSPCIRDSDLKASIKLGGSGDEGRLRLRRQDGEQIDLEATSRNLTNPFSNDAAASNGLVKAWAAINADGTIAACWRCNTDPLETRKFGTGDYEVDFTPLATDIRGRPRSATISAPSAPPLAVVRVINRNVNGNGVLEPDDSSVHVITADPVTGNKIDAPFVILIY